VGASRRLAEAAQNLMALAKGNSQAIQDPAIRQRLLDAVRNISDVIARMIDSALKLEGQPPDEAQTEWLKRQHDKVSLYHSYSLILLSFSHSFSFTH
jgi:hypothetical protein